LGARLKRSDTFAHIPLVMMTSMAQRGDAAHFRDIGFDGYLPKPIRQSELYDTLVAVISGDHGDDHASSSLVTRHTVREQRRGAVRILLAEDNVSNQEVARTIITTLGYTVDVVTSGREALQALHRTPYDMVLMDVQMPEMDGYEATRRIRDTRSSVLNHYIPVIAMTAHALKGDKQKCLDAGMDDYIAKPITPEALERLIDTWLERVSRGTVGDDASGTGTASGEAASGDASSHRPGTSGAGSSPTASSAEEASPAKASSTPPSSHDDGLPHMQSTYLFDHETFLHRMQNNAQTAHTLARVFLQDIPRQLEKLQKATANDDMTNARLHAHSIKGMAANINSEAVRSCALQVEDAAHAHELDTVQELVPRLRALCDLLVQRLAQV
jgi:CheY-like chemotaxis protein